MKVSEMMTQDVKVINIDRTAREAAEMMRDGDYGSLPVEENDRLAGMITDRDLTVRVLAEGKDPSTTKVKDCISEGIAYCFEDESMEDVSRKMAKAQYRRLPVLNRDKQLVGILSIGDMATHEPGKSTTHETLNQICH